MLGGSCVLGAVLVAAPVFAVPVHRPTDQVTFRVEARRDVPNDWISATLGVEEEGPDTAALAARVNQRMAKALELAKGDERLSVSSGAYQTQPVYDKTRIARWRVTQDLVIETAEVEALTQMAGQLQSLGLALRGVSFSVAPETKKRVEDELIVEALSLFRERAGLIARGLGRRGWNLINVALGDSGVPTPLYAERMAMGAAASAPAPALESGRSTLRIEVNATIELDK